MTFAGPPPDFLFSHAPGTDSSGSHDLGPERVPSSVPRLPSGDTFRVRSQLRDVFGRNGVPEGRYERGPDTSDKWKDSPVQREAGEICCVGQRTGGERPRRVHSAHTLRDVGDRPTPRISFQARIPCPPALPVLLAFFCSLLRTKKGDIYYGELEPEDKELDSFSKEHPHYYRPLYSIAKPIYPSYSPWNYTPRPVPRPAPLYKPLPKREVSPKKDSPSETVAFNFQGQPIYTRGGLTRRPLSELLEPNTSIPWASIVRDPWWWEYPELRPYSSPYRSPYYSPLPFYLRDSYLSPVKRQYLWTKHPIRPFAAVY